MHKILVAYSGGLDTSVILHWLANKHKAKCVAYCADVGQGEELDGLEEKALGTGAEVCVIDDLRAKFASEFIYPMFRAAALYENKYLLGTSIARPCIAEGMVKAARKHGANAIAHGATGKGNDQIRFELSAAALEPKLEIIAPWRDTDFRQEFPGRMQMIAYAQKHKIPVEAVASKSYSMDRNLLHISYESGILEDPWTDASDEKMADMYKLSKAPEDAQASSELLSLRFEKGDCVALQSERLADDLSELGLNANVDSQGFAELNPLEVFLVLNKMGYRHGIGRRDIVENRFVGMKSRGVYETPGGTILFAAGRELEALCMDREVMALRDQLSPQYARMVYNGFWFAPEREALQVFFDKSQENVSGEVRLRLYKGNVMPAGRRSPNSLYNPEAASMDSDDIEHYNQDDATGFIKLNALRLRSWQSRK